MPSLQRPIYGGVTVRTLPPLHLCCFNGDVLGVLACIKDGHSIHEAIIMKNQAGQPVCGISPLFLAAQKGRTKICKLLVQNGANPNHASYIQGTSELCTPAQVAQLNMHLLLAYYLRKVAKQRRKEEAAAAEAAVQAELNIGAQQQCMDQVVLVGQPGPSFTANLSDLPRWDPAIGDAARMDAKEIKKVMERTNLDLYSWHPDGEPRASAAPKGPAPLRMVKTMPAVLGVSKSRVVDDPDELVELRFDGEPVGLDNGAMLNRFLHGLDAETLDGEPPQGRPESPGGGHTPFDQGEQQVEQQPLPQASGNCSGGGDATFHFPRHARLSYPGSGAAITASDLSRGSALSMKERVSAGLSVLASVFSSRRMSRKGSSLSAHQTCALQQEYAIPEFREGPECKEGRQGLTLHVACQETMVPGVRAILGASPS